MNHSHWIPVAISLLWIPIASAAETCPSENGKVTPGPAELAKMCPQVTKQLIKQGMSAAADKMPWTGIDAYAINSSMKGINVPGDLFYVKTTKGVKTVHLKVMGKAPDCVEAVVRYVDQH